MLPQTVPYRDAVYNLSHAAVLARALETGNGDTVRAALRDRLHQPYRKKLIEDYETIEALVRTTGAAFCLSGAGPTLLCITLDEQLEQKLAKKLDSMTKANWYMLPLHVEFQGARVISEE